MATGGALRTRRAAARGRKAAASVGIAAWGIGSPASAKNASMPAGRARNQIPRRRRARHAECVTHSLRNRHGVAATSNQRADPAVLFNAKRQLAVEHVEALPPGIQMRAGSAARSADELDERQLVACLIAAEQSADGDAAEHQMMRPVPSSVCEVRSCEVKVICLHSVDAMGARTQPAIPRSGIGAGAFIEAAERDGRA